MYSLYSAFSFNLFGFNSFCVVRRDVCGSSLFTLTLHVPHCHAAGAGRGAVLSCISLQGCWHTAPCPLGGMRSISAPATCIGVCIGKVFLKNIFYLFYNVKTSQLLDFYLVTPLQHSEQRAYDLSWTKGTHTLPTDVLLKSQTMMRHRHLSWK